MGGVGITFDDSGAQKLLGGILKRMGDKTPVMKVLGEASRTDIIRNFEVEGRPKWKKLEKITLKSKKGK